MGMRVWILVEGVLVPFLGRARVIGVALVGWLTAALLSTLLGGLGGSLGDILGSALKWVSFAGFVFFAACCACAFLRWAERHKELFPPGREM
jgi:hypothetical protein